MSSYQTLSDQEAIDSALDFASQVIKAQKKVMPEDDDARELAFNLLAIGLLGDGDEVSSKSRDHGLASIICTGSAENPADYPMGSLVETRLFRAYGYPEYWEGPTEEEMREGVTVLRAIWQKIAELHARIGTAEFKKALIAGEDVSLCYWSRVEFNVEWFDKSDDTGPNQLSFGVA